MRNANQYQLSRQRVQPISSANRTAWAGHTWPAGHSLVEVMVIVSILAILLQLSLPHLNLNSLQEPERVVQELTAIIRLAQHQAILNAEDTMICPIGPHDTCSDDWSKGLQIRSGSTDQLLGRTHWPALQGSLSWRGFGARQYLIVDAAGGLLFQNGSFLWCPADNDPQPALQLLVNSAGRIRLTREHASGASLTC
jgi:type IV fimbrial biogenesis protein FimT